MNKFRPLILLAIAAWLHWGAAVAQPQPAPKPRAYLGASFNEDAGAVIGWVMEGSAAHQAGLAAGDRVLRLDGAAVESAASLIAAIGQRAVGDPVLLTVQRAGRVFDVPAVMRSFASDPAAWGVYLDLVEQKWLLQPDQRDILTVEWIAPDRMRQTLRPFGDRVGTYAVEIAYDAERRSLQLRYPWGETLPGKTEADGAVTFEGKPVLFVVKTGNGMRRRPDGQIEYWVAHGGTTTYGLAPTSAATEARMIDAQQHRVAQAKAQERERDDALMRSLGAMSQAMTAATRTASANEARSRVALNETLAQASRPPAAMPGANPAPTHAPADTSARTGAPAQTPPAPPAHAQTKPVPLTPSATPAAQAGASTRPVADGCVGQPVTQAHKCGSRSGLVGRVANSCAAPVDVRLCFMTGAGWKCQVRYGLAPEEPWEPGDCGATGQVFRSVRYSDAKEPLASP